MVNYTTAAAAGLLHCRGTPTDSCVCVHKFSVNDNFHLQTGDIATSPVCKCLISRVCRVSWCALKQGPTQDFITGGLRLIRPFPPLSPIPLPLKVGNFNPARSGGAL